MERPLPQPTPEGGRDLPAEPLRACLIDVYDTVVSCDFSAHAVEMPALAGVERDLWEAAFRELGPAVGDGRLSLSDAFADVINRAGEPVREEHLRELLRRDAELLREAIRLHDDTIPLLETLRRRGVLTAIVSNCADNTRLLLADLGLIELVDAVVLSCEVGVAKPDPSIYEHALRLLGVPASAAVFVDDQPVFCDGAAALGIHAVRICRDGQERAGGAAPTVASLAEIERFF
jgi:putative hydrolase of the HAD superfamily